MPTPKKSGRSESPTQPAPRQGVWSRRWLLAGLIVGVMGAGAMWLFARERPTAIYDYRVVKTYPHDARAFCQGLVIHEGVLYEGTGKYGESELRRVELKTGEVRQRQPLDRRLFGEGITVWGDKIYQLTWKGHLCMVYDRESFALVDRFRYGGEGWGLTHDGTHLLMSDGSSTIRVLNPDDFRLVRRLFVKNNGRPLMHLNELEFVEGEIFANVWRHDQIARIDPETGHVTGWIDLTGLYPRRERRHPENVLNGIAYDDEKRQLFVTGKYWPQLYHIELTPRR